MTASPYAWTVQTKLSKYRCRTAILLLQFFTSGLLQWLFFRQTTLRQIILDTLLQWHKIFYSLRRTGMLCIWRLVLSVGWFSVLYPLPTITCVERTNRANIYSICMAAIMHAIMQTQFYTCFIMKNKILPSFSVWYNFFVNAFSQIFQRI
jgi:hypothetical protein